MPQKISQEDYDAKFNQIFEEYFESIKNDPVKLHQTAVGLNWGTSVEDQQAIIRNKNTGLGTAVMLFWLGQPCDYWVPYENAEVADDAALFSFLDEVHKNIATGFYDQNNIQYDPTDDMGTNWVEDYDPNGAEVVNKICDICLNAVAGTEVEPDEDLIEGFPEAHWDKLEQLDEDFVVG